MEEFQARMEQSIERWNEALEELRPMLEAVWKAIFEMMRVILAYIKRVCEALRRWWLYVKLIRWHFPHRVAKFLADRWPRRWLPSPVGDWRG